jgi:hypothetical protein
MNTHTEPRTVSGCHCGLILSPDTRRHAAGCNYAWQDTAARTIPEWRRRSMEGRGRFDAVTDTTGLKEATE